MKRCIVIFFDTNVLVYFTINQDNDKFEMAQKRIYEAIKTDTFCISPLVLSEYIFVLSKYKVTQKHKNKVLLFSEYVQDRIDKEIVLDAYALCEEIDFCKNINDVMHLKVAEAHCHKLLTFDSDFKRLQKYTTVEIEII